MARKGGNPDIAKHGFKKGDPRINRSGRRIPPQQKLFAEMMGSIDFNDMQASELGQVVAAMLKEAKSGRNKVAAAKEIFERVWGKTAIKVIDQREDIDPDAPKSEATHTVIFKRMSKKP
jgi:hypothetical protein